MKNFLPGILLVTAVAVFGPTPAVAQQTDNKWGAHIDLEGKVGTDRNLGETDLFIPLWQDDTTLAFGSIRTRMDDNNSREGNFGIGIRQMQQNGWNIGGYGYFDRRRSPYGNHFNQATFGLEALSRDIDVRVNGYVPLGKRIRQVDALNDVSISGTSVMFVGGEERSLGGFDAEVGWRAPVFAPDAGQQLRLYLGGYRFADGDVPQVQGPRGRLDLTFDEVPRLWAGSRLSLGAEIQHDSPRGTQAFASIRLRIPLYGGDKKSRLSVQERRMTAPIIRDIDVVTQAGAFGTPETATTLDGDDIKLLDSSSTSDLVNAITNAGSDATVMLSGSFNTTNEVTVQSGQTIVGGGTMTVKSPSGRTATLSLPSATVTGSFSGATGNAVFQMADNSTLKNVTIDLTSTNGTSQAIDIANVSNVTISNNTITSRSATAGFAARGIISNTVSNVTIENNTVKVTGDNHDASGIFINGASTSNTIDNNKITVSSGSNFAFGISLGANAETVISNNTFSSTGGGLSNASISMNDSTILAGSTGNVRTNNEACRTTGTNTGSASFTDASTCP
ncbi:hypothetical protein HED22_05450 [Thalassospira sp. HF15]|uniref:right-handed parallel beta-helix repeat-containing protein n=1 Tax=Thalassospira sp. HF15 TaxID=2722755 RepID=UPI00142FF72D|nr:right-handed parallel beta-helix repeat-containing protein [Thalassospira sp. HF15]NIY75083.1 hypothetical protein [Thalassospira sp. HF15]